MERGWKPNVVEISPNCPRCGSSNTKFCYYNNYSLTQPRYLCKGCRRYWTKGGSLRNVPVGGGCRKNRRPGKSTVRLSSDGVYSTKACYNNDTIGQNGNNTTSSSGSRMQTDGSHIDLARVYANFLNQQPSSVTVDHHRFEFSTANLVPELENHMFYNIYDDHNNKHEDEIGSGLPPLPSSEALWLNMELEATTVQEANINLDQRQDPDLLFGNWSPFDVTFSKTT